MYRTFTGCTKVNSSQAIISSIDIWCFAQQILHLNICGLKLPLSLWSPTAEMSNVTLKLSQWKHICPWTHLVTLCGRTLNAKLKKSKIIIQAGVLSKPLVWLISSSFNCESDFSPGVVFYGFTWSVFSCLSSCLLLNNLNHLGLPIMIKQTNRFKDVVCVCVCVYLCSIWSYSAVTLYFINM